MKSRQVVIAFLVFVVSGMMVFFFQNCGGHNPSPNSEISLERAIQLEAEATPGPGTPPGALPNSEDLVLWLKADDLKLRMGDRVGEWKDSSPAKNHAEQDEVPFQPVFFENALGDKPGVRFNGRSDFMRVPDSATLDLEEMTVVVALASEKTGGQSSGADAQWVLSKASAIGDFSSFGMLLTGDSVLFTVQSALQMAFPRWGMRFDPSPAKPYVFLGSYRREEGEARDGSVLSDGSSTQLLFIPNGYNSSFDPKLTHSEQPLQIGRNLHAEKGGTGYLHGYVFEVQVFKRRLSAVESYNVVNTLKKKWGIN